MKASHRAPVRQAGCALLCVAALASGCSSAEGGIERFYDSRLALDTPIDWWHQLQGGVVAQDRPPPPGVGDPYPNFAKVPPKPTPIDPATRRALIARFTSERDQVQRRAAQDPIVWPVPGVPDSPAGEKPATGQATTGQAVRGQAGTGQAITGPGGRAAGAPATPAPAADAATAPGASLALEAASAPPPKPVPAAPVNDPHPPAEFTVAAPVASGPVPALPEVAPALPSLPGLPIDVPVPVVPRPRPSETVRFAAGSSALPAGSEAALRALVARRAGGSVAVIAGGEARGSDLRVQQAALKLALARTGAIRAALLAAGVPGSAIQAEATAQGREGVIRLLD